MILCYRIVEGVGCMGFKAVLDTGRDNKLAARKRTRFGCAEIVICVSTLRQKCLRQATRKPDAATAIIEPPKKNTSSRHNHYSTSPYEYLGRPFSECANESGSPCKLQPMAPGGSGREGRRRAAPPRTARAGNQAWQCKVCRTSWQRGCFAET